MTIIFGFSTGDYPLLIGDVLLSGGIGNGPQSLPTIGPVPYSLATEFGVRIAGVRQKINILHDNLALAWSGNFLAAYALAKKLKQHVNDNALSTEGIAGIIKEGSDDLACILLVVEGQRTSLLWQNVQSIELTQFKHVRFAGSGSNYFIKTIKTLDASKPVSDAPGAFQPIGTALTIASQCVGREMFTLNTLMESWGGAIEICFPVDGKLQKLDNVAFLQVIYDADEPSEDFTFAPRVLLNRYYADRLVCRAISFRVSDDNADKLLVDSDEITLIEPLLRSSTPIIKSSASEFEYDYLCTCLRYRNRRKNRSWSESFVYACPGKLNPGPLKIRFDGKNATVVITDELKGLLRAAVLAFEQEDKAP
jgi:hypothetical protein